ncbi:MAG: glycosyltransferase [Elusimicrobiota bacterium]|nr:glycosyltransferase [Elusimicrobiota bacterium]
MSAPSLSAVLPTLDEADSVEPLLDGLFDALGPDLEVVVVDDGSTDGTPSRALAYARAHTGRAVVVLRRAGPRGLTASLRDGFAAARGERVVWLDADLSMPPADAARLVAALSRCDLAVGSRFLPGAGWRKSGPGSRDASAPALLSLALNAALRLLLGRGLTDYTSGFAAARRETLLRLGLEGGHGEYFMDLVCRARDAGLRVEELPYAIRPRRHGRSKTAPDAAALGRRGVRYLATALKLALRDAGRRGPPASPSRADASAKPAADSAASTSARRQ